MNPSMPARATVTGFFLMILTTALAATVLAQPSLDSLWPSDDGLRWTYAYSEINTAGPSVSGSATLQLQGTVMTAGGQAQVLIGQMDVSPAKAAATGGYGGVLGAIWQGRPDLRAAIAGRYGAPKTIVDWTPFFLHDGYFMKTATAIRMWQPSWNHATWTYLTDDLAVGATFTHQLVPELASDIFLHGTVGAVGVLVITPPDIFAGSVRLDYDIDLGQAAMQDESTGDFIGYVHGEYHGHVYYVPGIGPVEMLEERVPYVSVDCGPNPCPPEWLAQLGQVQSSRTLMLAQVPLATKNVSWSSLKAMYR